MQADTQYDMITDYITGRQVPDTGAEANRQAVERILVERKGYAPEDIEVDRKVAFIAGGQHYSSAVDLVVFCGKTALMVIKCAAGSLDSRRKEAVAAARILFDPVVPLAAASDGRTALVFDAVSGKQIGEGLEAIPDARSCRQITEELEPFSLPEKRLEKERIIFRSYDIMNVNVCREPGTGGQNP
ncbi:MAG: type I restriction enzyme HsdR N-terminal domain-containing protein [Desulfosalsimonas sp.]